MQQLQQKYEDYLRFQELVRNDGYVSSSNEPYME
jgi:hypothetical protein